MLCAAVVSAPPLMGTMQSSSQHNIHLVERRLLLQELLPGSLGLEKDSRFKRLEILAQPN